MTCVGEHPSRFHMELVRLLDASYFPSVFAESQPGVAFLDASFLEGLIQQFE